jgi:peptidyl-prolyl cis-trans isomerase C
LSYVDLLLKVKNFMSFRRMTCGVLMVVAVAGLAACGSKDKKTGQALARVDGQEITVLQFNDELGRVRVQPGQQEAANKQLLDSLIDRQLILAEAMRNKVDRSPEVVQAIERAKAEIIAQAYLQSVISKVAKPSSAEIDDYYQKHPELFSKRKEFDLKQLVVANKNYSDELKSLVDAAKTLDEVSEWMDKHGIPYSRVQAIRSSTDLPPEAVTKLLELPKGQLFLVSVGDNKVLSVVIASRDSPVSATNAASQIEQFLTKEKISDAAKAEIASLRSRAKVEYLNGATAPVAAQTQTAAPDNKPAETK